MFIIYFTKANIIRMMTTIPITVMGIITLLISGGSFQTVFGQDTEEASSADGFIVDGNIHSLIFTPSTVWVATGPWDLVVEDGEFKAFQTRMIWYDVSGTSSHTHEIDNFEPEDDILMPRALNVTIVGQTTVGTNMVPSWEEVDTRTDLRGSVISLFMNDEQTDQHFGAQTIYGIVDSVTDCSDTPGPNMQILPPCELPGSGEG
jgi:hypothetical protein